MTAQPLEVVPDPESIVITEPGLYDVPEDEYHRDVVPGGSLSSTGARNLLPPSCPALFKYEQEHPTPSTKAQKFGTLAHALLLESGPKLHVYTKLDGRTKDGKAQAAELAAIEAEGYLLTSTSDYESARAMVDQIRKHPLASALFDPTNGVAEQAGYWRDRETDAWCRVRYDFLPKPRNGRLIFPDFKKTTAVDDESIRKTVARYWYPQQLDFYERGARALGLAEVVTGVLVMQMAEPPYLIRVVSPDSEARDLAAARNRRAIDLFARCQATGEWPGFGDEVFTATLPAYTVYAEESTAA